MADDTALLVRVATAEDIPLVAGHRAAMFRDMGQLELAERGVRRVVLHPSDEGRRLHQRMGFVPTNEMRLEEAL